VKLENGVFISTLFEELPVTHGSTTRAWGNLGFGKRPGDPDVVANRAKLFESFGLTNRDHIQTRQVHSNKFISAMEFVPGIEADAVYTDLPSDFLSVLTADCLPLLVYHKQGIAAAIHAGWRGIYDEIIPLTLNHLPSGTLVAAGPSIGPCCYEVGEDLADKFEQKFGPSVVGREPGKKPHLDLRKAAILQLQSAAVEEMEISEICTACHPDLFFSYRRDGSSGRMMSWIGLV
jgi:purine-nucleoside/S-methyl-5'-thioadenosine phosphorylase / adenosine deaminase